MKSNMLLGYSIMAIVFLIAAVAFIYKKNEIPPNHLEIVFRNIGHQLLLTAKDSTSRVLPVKKLNENTYRLSFQNSFNFISDTLINLVEREFKKNDLVKDYRVNVRDCEQKETVFGFEVIGKTGDLAPCKGRSLAVGCYLIEIELLKSSKLNFYWWLLLIIPFSFIWFYLKDILRQKVEKESLTDNNDFIPIGNFRFYTKKNVLKIENKYITLSEKETKALKIFSENVNMIVEREKLMKEIWEVEGVVVISRNVDVLVSKLRKKFSDDNSIKFINIHGRGYKFTIE
ncbi:MAG: helix-turn-helix domain-containing protein [Ferruginibacter sp.]